MQYLLVHAASLHLNCCNSFSPYHMSLAKVRKSESQIVRSEKKVNLPITSQFAHDGVLPLFHCPDLCLSAIDLTSRWRPALLSLVCWLLAWLSVTFLCFCSVTISLVQVWFAWKNLHQDATSDDHHDMVEEGIAEVDYSVVVDFEQPWVRDVVFGLQKSVSCFAPNLQLIVCKFDTLKKPKHV